MKRLRILVGLAILLGSTRAWCQSAARQAGYLYLSPVPQASYTPEQTRYVLVRFVNVAPATVTNLAAGFISVTGATSGPHPGVTHLASDGKTVIFTMNTDFATNELVTVVLNPLLGPGTNGSVAPFSYEFMTTAPMPDSVPLATLGPAPAANSQAPRDELRPQFSTGTKHKGTGRKAMILPNGVSVPSDFPQVVITADANPSPGYLFLENALDDVPPYTMMLDNNGMPVWYSQGRMFDFKIQRNGMMTWCQYDNTGLAVFSAFDQNLNFIRTYATTNGYLTDGHDLKILPDGRYFMIGFHNNMVDLSQYLAGGGLAEVTETAVQGFTAAGELVFQWRAWDNYDVRDLVPSGNTDFPHMNGIDIDDDGNLLVSARHLSEVTKINLQSGDIMWRLSGAHSSFQFVNDPLQGTSYQHNISALGNGHYMVFDNGDYHPTLASRAVEYQLNLTNMTATMAWQFRDVPDKYTYWMGNAQRLPSGNTLIDFVLPNYPKAIEVDTNGVKHFELSLVPGSDSYRAFRFPWSGAVAAPYLVAEPQVDNITLVFNKFGDTNVVSYRIYGGTAPHPTTLLDESTTTLAQLTNLPNGPFYFRVTAVNRDGVESPFSNEVNVNVNLVQPGQNMALNGDFSEGSSSWLFNVNGTASANWAITGGTAQFNITSQDDNLNDVQLLQGGIPLVLGQDYVLEFDAWADQSGYIQTQLAQILAPFADYSGLAPTFLTPNRAHFTYRFTMQQPSDSDVNLVFNLGGFAGTVFLANVSLFSPVTGDLNADGRVDLLDLDTLSGNWLKQKPGLPGDLDGNGKVDFNDFNLLGQSWGLGVH